MKKRIFALLMIATLLFSMTVFVFAGDEEDPYGTNRAIAIPKTR